MRSTLDSFRGCLLGGALGDALGNPIEFTAGDVIVGRHGLEPPADLAFAGPAQFTDDTQMTLFAAEGVIRAHQRVADRGFADAVGVVARAFLRWYETQTGVVAPGDDRGWLIGERGLHVRRAPGNTCMAALAALARGGAAPSVSAPPNDSKGCGAVMRAAPFGLAAAERTAAFDLARDTGVLTHGHPSGHLSGAYLAALIWGLAHDESPGQAMAAADQLLVTQPGHGELTAILGRVRDLAATGAPPDRATIEALGGGWVGEEALAIGLLCALTVERDRPDAVARALWRAAAHGGDSDSTASIAGNLLGAELGAAALPGRWLARLELGTVVDRVARDLHAVARDHRPLDRRDYPPA